MSANDAVWRTELAGLPAPKHGKVRDVYDLGDKLLLVATGEFVHRLAGEKGFDRSFRLVDGPRSWVAIQIEGQAGKLLVGIRKLGMAQLKGLDATPVYEIVDAALWGDHTLFEMRGLDLFEAIESPIQSKGVLNER